MYTYTKGIQLYYNDKIRGPIIPADILMGLGVLIKLCNIF